MSRRKGNDRLHGVLVVDKPGGMTSAAVVGKVRRALGARRIGHTGTLDPMATGVLPLCLGDGTKLASYLLAEDKAYEGELELGVETDTLDREGQVVARDPEGADRVTEAALRDALAARLGPGTQIPPMYSALKHQGRRLHELARAGEVVERPPRPIRIDRLELLSFDPPRARFAVECSKGTYVRTLVDDLGRDLGCGAHLTALRRTRSGGFDLSRALQLEDIAEESAAERLISPAAAVGHLPAFPVAAERVAAVVQGQPLGWDAIASSAPPPGLVCLLTPGRELLALVHVEGTRLRYDRVFARGLTNGPSSSNLPRQ